MNRNRQRIDPLATMIAANPTAAADLAAWIREVDLEQAMERAVALGRASSPSGRAVDGVVTDRGGDGGAPRARLRSGRTRQGRGRVAFGFGLTSIVALAALVVVGWLGGAGGGRPDFAIAAIRVAEANPRLLVTAPGWKVVRADEFERDSGELTFSDGGHRLEVHWYPARFYERYLRDRANVSVPTSGSLLGRRATTVQYSSREYATMLSPQGSLFIEVRGRLGSERAYDEILRSLRPVDVETWLGAMPPATVRPEVRSETVDRMLRGIPLPAGFDVDGLQSESSISDRSMLAVKVGNAVACGWVESWIAARRDGDHAAARQAVEAMSGSNKWPIMRETEVPWFSNYAIVAKQLRVGRLNRSPSGYEVQANGKTFAFGPAWRSILGCGGTYRREVDPFLVPAEGESRRKTAM